MPGALIAPECRSALPVRIRTATYAQPRLVTARASATKARLVTTLVRALTRTVTNARSHFVNWATALRAISAATHLARIRTETTVRRRVAIPRGAANRPQSLTPTTLPVTMEPPARTPIP